MHEITAGSWYRMAGCYGMDVDLVAIAPTGSVVRMLGRGVSAQAPQWSAITVDGDMHEINAAQIDRPGIGGLTVLDRAPGTIEDVLALRAKGVQAKHHREEQATAQAEAKARERADLPARFPYLEQAKGSKKSGHALGAANIRKELKRVFPNCAFSVTSESYSGGNAIRIGWTDGPTTAEVEKIAGKYEEGSFNGMEDIYEYSGDQFPEVFGGAKYVSCARHISDEVYQAVMEHVWSDWADCEGIPLPTLDELWSSSRFRIGNRWASEHVRHEAQQMSYYVELVEG